MKPYTDFADFLADYYPSAYFFYEVLAAVEHSKFAASKQEQNRLREVIRDIYAGQEADMLPSNQLIERIRKESS